MTSPTIDENGNVYSWGVNDGSALGRQTTGVPNPEDPTTTLNIADLESQPTLIQTLIDENFRAVHVAAGDSISVAIGDDGGLRAWGSFRTSDGPLGFTGLPTSDETQVTPVAVNEFKYIKFVDVACGNDHVVALTREGEVFCFGDGEQGQIGRRVHQRRRGAGLQPERLSLTKIVLVSTGSYHSFAVQQDGIVWAWGLDSFHQTGVATRSTVHQETITTPAIVTALSPTALNGRWVTAISGGEHHSLFLLSDGSVWGCGRCDGHELGLPLDHPAMADIVAKRLLAGDVNRPIARECSPPAQIFSSPAPTLPRTPVSEL